MHKLILCLFLLLFTVNDLFANAPSDTTLPWIEQVKDFRDAVYRRDKERAKKYISFPVNGNHSLWYIVRDEQTDKNSNTFDKLAEKNSPLTEKLFDAYFDQIFFKRFVSTFLKIKTKELYEKGETTTPEFSGNAEIYQMSATFDAEEQTVTLNIFGRTIADEGEEHGEFAYIYKFALIKGQLKLTDIFMAG